MSEFKSGYVALVGRPNVGKSTLLNALIGTKIAATTHKPQTTRKNLLGVIHLEGAQMLLLDTPGYHRAKGPLNRFMVGEAKSAIRDADVIGYFTDKVAQPKDWTVTGQPMTWNHDTAEIMIDPAGDGDNKDYFEIQIGPQNLVFDSHFDDYNHPKAGPNGPFGHENWSSEVKSAVRVSGTIDDDSDRDVGYTIEARFPWSAFEKAAKVPPDEGDTWRMNFYAMENNGGVAWSPILGKGNFHKASRFGRVTFKR